MPTYNLTEGEDAIENDLESDNQQIGFSRHKPLLSQTIVKDSPESIEPESVSGGIEKCVKLINNQRSSNRLTKRLRRDNSPVDAILKKSVAIKQDTPSIGSKTRRPWELWSVEDKNAFFEALCEYGKDFESIQSYIAQRSKKKGIAANMIKNKDQVRHFYYRTWHKISKFLEISECVRKQTQELYGLINYAELRKKIGGCLNEKNRQKLNELVFSGVTTVKHKGKKLRIKTPVCRALKKLNNVSDTKEPETEKLPKDIFVEFRPHSNAAWLQVQNLAQNPRVRTKVCLQKRLRPVIEYLQRRWRPYRLKRKEQILTSLPNPVSDDLLCDNPPVLRVKPARDAKISALSLSAMDIASSSDVCLEKYMKLSHKTLRKDINKVKKVSIPYKQKVSGDKLTDSCETISEKLDVSETVTEYPDTDNNNHVDTPDLCLKSGNKNATEDNSYINLLTPPKSVPELELPSDQNFTEVQRSLSLLSSMLDTTGKKTNSFASDDVDLTAEENEENPCGQPSENKTTSFLEETEKDNQVIEECNLESNQVDNGFDDNMTLSQFLGLNSKQDLMSPDSLLEKDKFSSENPSDCFKEEIPSNSESIYYKTVRNGWTTVEAGFLTFGELYLLLGKPSTIVLEYEFEQADVHVNHSEDDAETSTPVPSEISCVLNKVFEVAHSFFTDAKNKPVPGKQHGRSNTSKSTKIKTCGLSERTSKEYSLSLLNSNIDTNIASKDGAVNKDSSLLNSSALNVTDSSTSSDKHVFVMPVGTAPRNMKPPDQTSLKEEIGKLLPGTRRGCRVRRKPLVVQRPLLPREGMRTLSGPRPMTVVHFVPSVSPLTAVIPSSCARPENKISIPAAKKVVKILSPGSSLDMHPIQVPVIKQVHTDPGQNVILQQSSVPASHVIVNSTSGKSIQIINDQNISCHLPAVNSTVTTSGSIIKAHENPTVIQSQSIIPEVTLSSSSSLDGLNLDLLSGSQKNSNKTNENFVSLPQISIPDTTNPLSSSISATAASSFLDDFGLSTKSKLYDTTPNSSACLSVDLAATKTSTPPGSPSHQPFRINSPEIQWLNGESTELSLNTFLNSMESPSKITSASTSNITTENSNLDPIVRLAPVVDSQVRCLLDECSIDFITKFEDLADVINNSSSSESKQT